jgi:hypothetical protein
VCDGGDGGSQWCEVMAASSTCDMAHRAQGQGGDGGDLRCGDVGFNGCAERVVSTGAPRAPARAISACALATASFLADCLCAALDEKRLRVIGLATAPAPPRWPRWLAGLTAEKPGSDARGFFA